MALSTVADVKKVDVVGRGSGGLGRGGLVRNVVE